MNRRHFKITGTPLVARTMELLEQSRRLQAEAEQMADSLGAVICHYNSSFSGTLNFAGFQRKPDAPVFDPDLWRQERRSRLWHLRARALNGKGEQLQALQQLVAPYRVIPQPWAVLDELGDIGLSNGPLIVLGCKAYSPGFTLVEDMPQADGSTAPTIFISVPWVDDAGEDTSNRHFVERFNPPADWVEIKEWEKLRDLDLADQARKERAQ